ncbi:Shedu anti-phage system protein SduA domain-containing protein [Nocardiopsis mangrovi]|uniref:Shedu anti-phage system protein SduA domain-containing protein n=1 Tax=Nocardiopsis mangrovi TaxID=1179818 RepID=A0ABV9DZE7_9ACTN
MELQLEKTREEAGNEAVRSAITGVLHHMRSGRGRHRRGGRQLIVLLELARSQAAGAEEWYVVRLLQDSLDYAEERILQADFTDRYRLFQDGKRSPLYRDYVAGSTWIANEYSADATQEYLNEHPEATVHEVIMHFRSLSRDALFIDAPEDRPGRYRLLRGRAEMAEWMGRILMERLDVEDPVKAAKQIVMSPEAWAVLASDTNGQTLLKAAEMQRRSAGLAILREVAENPAASENDLQQALKNQYWIFGGRFIGEAAYRRLVPGDEINIPLIRGDGSLHVVELKRASNLHTPLVKRHRNAWVATAQVHDAVGQAVNYLVGLDENRHRIRREFGIEVRRASAAVLIGHPATQPEIPEEAINEALRTLNTHLSRVEVMTYKDLIDSAQRSLDGPSGL